MASLTVVPLELKKRDIRRFVKFPWAVYDKDSPWVPPLIGDQVEYILRGVYHETGVIQPFMAFRGNVPVGRIIAHYDTLYNSLKGVKQGCFGFFECLRDDEAASALFEAASKWCVEQGMETIKGPLNFMVYDASGFLIDGFEQPQVVDQVYNPPYYPEMVEANGFARELDWYAYRSDRTIQVPPVLQRIRERMERENPSIRFSNGDMKKFEASTERYRQLFNEAWKDNSDHRPYSEAQFSEIPKKIKMFINPELVMQAEDGDKLVGMMIIVPDIYQALKKLNGRLFPFGIVRLLRGIRSIDCIRMYVTGIHPDYRGRGIETFFYTELYSRGMRLGYQTIDISLVVETNTALIRSLETISRRYKTYRFYTKSLKP